MRMNPILLKPSSDIGSQVIVGGEVRGQMSAAEYFRGKAPAGAGGPLRLREPGGGERCHRHRGGGQPGGDQPPGGRHREHGPGGAGGRPGAPGRGHRPGRGVRPAVRHRGIAAAPGAPAGEKGLLINKFRGDEAILRPGLAMLEELTDIPVLGVVPYLRVDIDDEDSWPPGWKPGGAQALDIAVIRLPRISNFTDFSLLEEHPALGVRYVQSCRELGRPRPGGPAGDQEHPGRPPLAAAERPGGRHPEAGLGRHPGAGGVRRLPDAGPQPGRPLGHRGGAESSAAWGCCRWTRCSAPKRPAPGVRGQVTAPGLAGAQLDGYEIHTAGPRWRESPSVCWENGQPDGCAHGNVFGTYLHGLFDTGSLTQKLAEYLCAKKGITGEQSAPVSPPGAPGAPAGPAGRGPAPGLGHGRGPRYSGRGAVRCGA